MTLELQNDPSSPCLSPGTILESAIYPKTPGNFFFGNSTGNQDLGTGCAYC